MSDCTCANDSSAKDDWSGDLRGRPLRYLLTTILREAGQPLTVRQLVSRCEHEGVVFAGRASKIVSDALRWEARWGRVARCRRGVYSFNRAPRSTVYWIKQRVLVTRERLRRQQAERRLAGADPATLALPGWVIERLHPLLT